MDRFKSNKKPGNILSAFLANKHDILPDKFKILKKDILRHSDLDNVQKSWTRLIESFDKEIEVIQSNGPEVIPQIEFSKIAENNFQFPSTFAAEVRKRGCVVVRNVVDSSEAVKYKTDVQQYINKHEGSIAGYPGKRFPQEVDFVNLISVPECFRNKSSSMGDLLVESESAGIQRLILEIKRKLFS